MGAELEEAKEHWTLETQDNSAFSSLQGNKPEGLTNEHGVKVEVRRRSGQKEREIGILERKAVDLCDSRLVGTISRMMHDKGFGFISQIGSRDELFFHHTALIDTIYRGT